MILADTSVWVDHFRNGNQALADLLQRQRALVHPWVIGELALGGLRQRAEIIHALRRMPAATVATDTEVLSLIEKEALHGSGIGYVDAQLLAATRLTADAGLWTLDGRLASVAARLDVAATP